MSGEDASLIHVGQEPTVIALLRDAAVTLLHWHGVWHIATRLRAHRQPRSKPLPSLSGPAGSCFEQGALKLGCCHDRGHETVVGRRPRTAAERHRRRTQPSRGLPHLWRRYEHHHPLASAWRRCRGRSTGSASRSVLTATEQDPDRRADWREALDGDDPASLVVVEESGTNLAMTPRGERVVGTAPRTHSSKTPLVAALSLDGISAAMTVEGAAFDVVVERLLVPRRRPGQIVVWDTRSSPKWE
jgi:hypothetical protein